MSQIKYIFRDFWGTVAELDIKKDSYLAQIMKLYGLSKDEASKAFSPPMIRFSKGEISEHNLWEIFSKNIGQSQKRSFKYILRRPLHHYSRIYPSIKSLIKKLQSQGIFNIIASDDNIIQSKMIRKRGWYDVFDDVILSCEIGVSKFDDVRMGTKKYFNFLLKKYKILANECLFVDDKDKNCKVADVVGMKTVLAKNPRQTIRDIKELLKI